MIKQPFLLLLGGFAFIVALVSAIDRTIFLLRSETTIGYVSYITSKESRCRRSKYSSYSCYKYTAEITYYDKQNSQHELLIPAGSCNINYYNCHANVSQGQNIELIYNTASPTRAYRNTTIDVWGFTFGALAIGALLSISSFFEPKHRNTYSYW